VGQASGRAKGRAQGGQVGLSVGKFMTAYAAALRVDCALPYAPSTPARLLERAFLDSIDREAVGGSCSACIS